MKTAGVWTRSSEPSIEEMLLDLDQKIHEIIKKVRKK